MSLCSGARRAHAALSRDARSRPQAAYRLGVLQKEQKDLQAANQERVSAATTTVDIATANVAGLAENARLKQTQQRRNESQLTDVVRQLADAPVSERLLQEVRACARRAADTMRRT